MNATDPGFLGPARQARADASRETRLSAAAEDQGPRPDDFSALMRSDGATKPSEAPKPAAERAPEEAREDAATTGDETRASIPDQTTPAAEASDVDAAERADIPDTAEPGPAPDAPTPTPLATETPKAAAMDASATDAPDQPVAVSPGAAAAVSSTHPAPGESLGKDPDSTAIPAAPVPGGNLAAQGSAPAAPEPEKMKPQAEARGPRSVEQQPANAAAATPAHPTESAAAPAPPPTPGASIDAAVPGPGAQPMPDAAALSLVPAPPAGSDWRLVPAAPAQPHVAPDARAVLNQISVAVSKSEDSRIEIRLDPAELGRVHISLTQTEHGVRALVTAERPETLDLLRRNADTLTRELTAAGYGSVSLSMSQGGREQGGDPRSAGRSSDAYAATWTAPASSPAAAVPVAPPRLADGPLDIRL